MNKNFSDEQLDRILRKAVKNFPVNDELLNEIAGSGNLWRNVQNRIEREKEVRNKSWIPTWMDWRIAAFACAFIGMCAGLLLFLNAPKNDLVAGQKTPETLSVEMPKAVEKPVAIDPVSETPKIEKPKEILIRSIPVQKNILPKRNLKSGNADKSPIAENIPKKALQAVVKPEEIKTDFIALTYSSAPESGQILKVKVPRSMMVSLGVINKTENGAELVNAEVLVGDDGSAHSIRFTH